MKRNIVSLRILSRLYSGMNWMVRTLCRRSASLMSTMRTSSFRVMRMRRKFSAWRLWLELFLFLLSLSRAVLILVRPSTSEAILSPNRCRMSSTVNSVSSTTSCSRAAQMDLQPSPISSTTIFATAMGCRMYGSPERRRTPLWASLANSKALSTSWYCSSSPQRSRLEMRRPSNSRSISLKSSSVNIVSVGFYLDCIVFGLFGQAAFLRLAVVHEGIAA